MNRRHQFLWQIYPIFILVIVPSLFLVIVFGITTFKKVYIQEIASDLEGQAKLASLIVVDFLVSGKTTGLEEICQEMGKRTATRITTILPSGSVICDSLEDPGRLSSHADRPEIREALRGKTGLAVRYSTTLKKEMVYAAIPVEKDGVVVGVVRASKPLFAISTALKSTSWKIAIAGLIISLFSALISIILLKRINRPLKQIISGIEKFVQGNLKYRLPIIGSEEFRKLAETLNQMAEELEQQLATIYSQRDELEIILTTMVEGVLLVDHSGKILKLNHSAAKIFSVDPNKSTGQNLEEIIRNPEIQKLVTETISSRKPAEVELVLVNHNERFLIAHSTPIINPSNGASRALVVFHDITRLKHLEKVRQEFVANVTHELKTPLTSIQGFVETLRNDVSPEEAKKFLDIIAKETERLKAIIENILTLSRLEKENSKDKSQLSILPVLDILQKARQTCGHLAQEKSISIEVIGSPQIHARFDPTLLEQAVVNLIENAIKYSEVNSKVQVELAQEKEEILIRVQDWGIGIPPEHLERIFERFYRVDKSRSRKVGGTGLGLSIVKHIAQIHGGKVTVKSIPGHGSTFTIHLPAT